MMPLPLNDLSAFKPQAGNWKVAGSVTSPFTKDKEHHKLDYTAGAGILVNDNDAQHNSALISNLEHQDLDIEFEFMMPAATVASICRADMKCSCSTAGVKRYRTLRI